jgi:4-hydroxybenzoyl-CoA thioesterase
MAQDPAHHHERVVRFGECDPAGVVYYPVFFHWFHEAMEHWFETAVGVPYAEVLQQTGFPAVRTEADFKQPCRLGERLHVRVAVERMGGRSLSLGFTIAGAEDGAIRATGKTICVCIPSAGDGFAFSSAAIPPDLRAKIQAATECPGSTAASPE